MTFLQPANLFWAGLIALVLLVYLRFFAVREVEAPGLFLWREALARRPAWQRWQRFLSVALQIAILLALVLAAAEPAWVGQQRPKRTVAIIVDRSASMRATDLQPTRFDAALAAAKKQLTTLAPGDRAMVLSDGAFTDVLCPLTDDREAWATALDAIKPTDGVGRLSETVALAEQRLAGEGEHEILVYTDGSSPDAPAVAKRANVKLATFGTPEAANLALTRVAPRVSPAGEAETLVEVANFSGQAESAAVVGGRIDPGGRVRRILKNAAGQLALEKADALKADNSVDFPALSVQPRTILLVGEVHPAIAAAARAIPGVKVETAATPPGQAGPNTIVVVQGVSSTKLPPRAIVFEPTGDGDGWKAGELLERPLAVTQQQASPVLGDVALSEVVIEGARPLELTGGWQVAATAEGGVPIVAMRNEPGRAVLVNIDLVRSDLTQRREFATLVRQAVDWLSQRSAEFRTLTTTNDFIKVAEVGGEMRAAKGIDIPEGVSEYGPREQVGGYVSLLNPDESNLAPRVTGTIAESAAATASKPEWPLWWIPAGVAVLLLVLEWSLYQRRVTI